MIRFSRGMMLGAAMTVALGAGAAFAQQAEDAKPQALKFAPPAAALVIAIERVLDESASGKAIRTQIDAARDALRQEAVATDAALKAREEELVALKPTLSADEFEAKARAFEGQVREARITSLRKVDWGSMRVNFFVLFPLAAMPEVPTTYISAYQAPKANLQFDNQLVRQFPNITNVDMSQTIAQVQRVLGQVIRAVEFLFAFALAAGLIVLLATITATRGEREREFAVLRAVGAGSPLLRNVQRIELLGVGTLAGFLASLVAMAVGWALAKYAFQFSWQPSIWVPLLGSAAGGVLALMAGWWGLRSILRTPVVETLRRAAV